jgi:L-phenylalanine/L-methionine N-acetyltransferase
MGRRCSWVTTDRVTLWCRSPATCPPASRTPTAMIHVAPTATATVRRARPADAADFVRMMSQPEVYMNLMQLPLPSEDMWRKRLETMSEPERDDLQLVAELDGRVVGSAGLHPVPKLRRRHVAMLGISVAAEAQGLGVGRALMQTMCDYADRWAQILRIELTVFTDNARAIALYQRFGFRHEGTHRAYALRDGAYLDVHAMARLHPNPPRAAWPEG